LPKEERVSRTVKLVFAAFLFLFVIGATGCSKSPTIKTATVATQNLGVTVSASGKVSAGMRADVYPPVAGTIADVYVKDGQAVKAGQKLAIMDTGPLKLQVSQARSGVAQARSALAQIDQQIPSCADEKAAQANVDATKMAYDQAKKAYEYAKVPPSNPATVAITALQTKQARAAYLGAKAALHKVYEGDDVWAQRNAAVSAVNAANAALALAITNLNNATMTAPIDGTVFFNPTGTPGSDGKTPLPSAGAGVAPQAAPFSVANLGASTFTAEVDEADIDRVKVDMAANVTLDAFPGQTFKTKVVRINPAAQPTATGGTIFQVELSLEDTGKTILLGMKGDSTIEVSSVSSAVTIPVEALFNENGKNFVYKVENDKLVQTDITVGATTDTQVEVIKGVKAGDVVALSGPTQYTNGMTVKVQN
jgi:HlyD family secretion protein